MKLHVGSSSFDVTLNETETVKQFKNLLPLTVRMKDLHSNEKFYDLPKSLPTNASIPPKIEAGDIMLYGSNTIVLFYKSFSTSYSYTRLGKVSDPKTLEAALGKGEVTISFEFK